MSLYLYSETQREMAERYHRYLAILRDLVPKGRVPHEVIVEKVMLYGQFTGISAMDCLDNLCTELLSGIPLEGTHVWRKINQER